MSDNDLQITFGADASALNAGAEAAKQQLAGMAAAFKALSADANGAAGAIKAVASANGQDAIGVARETAQQQIKLAQEATAEKLKQDNDDLAHKRVTSEAYVAEVRAALAEQYAIVQAAYDQELRIAGQTETEKAALRRAEAVDLQRLADMELDAERRAADETEKVWRNSANQIESVFNAQLRGLLEGRESWSQAERKIIEDFVLKSIESFEKLAANFVIQEFAMTQAHTAGAAMRAAADQTASAGGVAALIANAAKAITVDAGQTAAGVTAFMAPFVGPAAPAVGAAAQASVLGFAAFDIGAWDVPQDQIAMIHKGELVATPSQAEAIRSLPSILSNSGGEGGGSVNLTPQLHLHATAMDGADLQRVLTNNSSAVAKALDGMVRHGAHLGLRSLSRMR